MRAVLQRVKSASVKINDRETARIKQGLLVLLGIGRDDKQEDASFLAHKITNLRIFEDHRGKMNLSVKDVKGEILVVSQFTLFADTRQGRRPSFTMAAPPEKALSLYHFFLEALKKEDFSPKTGEFQALMVVSLENDGPVTILLDSQDKPG